MGFIWNWPSLTCSIFMPTSLKPLCSKRCIICPTRRRWTPSGFTATRVRSLTPGIPTHREELLSHTCSIKLLATRMPRPPVHFSISARNVLCFSGAKSTCYLNLTGLIAFIILLRLFPTLACALSFSALLLGLQKHSGNG